MSEKSFYEVLWSLCLKEGLIDQWQQQGYLILNDRTFSWTPKVQTKLEIHRIIGELRAGRTSNKEVKKEIEITQEFLLEFVTKFSAKSLGFSGKTTDQKTVTKKLQKFFLEYDYTTEEILTATDACINSLRKQGNLKYIRECGYFVYKKIDGVEQSDLAKWCELVRENRNSNGGDDLGNYTSHRNL